MGPHDTLLGIGPTEIVSQLDPPADGKVVSRATTAAGLDYLDTADSVGAVITAHDPPDIDAVRLLDAMSAPVPVVVLTRNGPARRHTHAPSGCHKLRRSRGR